MALMARVSSKVAAGAARRSVVAAPVRPRAAVRPAVVVKASSQEDPSAELQKQMNDALKTVQEKWEATSDAEKPAAIAIIIGAVIAQISIGATMDAVNKIPFINGFLEFVGLAVTGVYAYRYFTDPAERENVKKSIDSFTKAVTGK
uniref:Cyanobacterial aminoacyl-tRNA synthetase CAAD domain-containing protein n=1 Tax=Chlamydomonas leiostraca TaxID=1034604 RepID=A0A7S0RU59_9CHLO